MRNGVGTVENRRQELVVLAEAEVAERRVFGERHTLELDDAADSGAPREVPGVGRKPVGDIEHRVCRAREGATFRQAERGPDVRPTAEGSARSAQRAGYDEDVTGPRAGA